MNTVADLTMERAEAVHDTVANIRRIEQQQDITRGSLENIKQQLIVLAARNKLFSLQDFPPPTPDQQKTSCLYRIAEDEDHRFALYINSTSGKVDTPPHNHTTWAVIVGIQGDENNCFYQKNENQVPEQTGADVVRQGHGVAFLPNDLHSIHISAAEPVINFHMYGLALEQLHQREYFSSKDQIWRVFPAHSDIREARAGKESSS